jgi:hypothetical protein
VDADLKDFFGSVDHSKLLTLVGQRVADGRVLRLVRAMLKAGSYGKGQLFPSERGTPPLLIWFSVFPDHPRRLPSPTHPVAGCPVTRFSRRLWYYTAVRLLTEPRSPLRFRL